MEQSPNKHRQAVHQVWWVHATLCYPSDLISCGHARLYFCFFMAAAWLIRFFTSSEKLPIRITAKLVVNSVWHLPGLFKFWSCFSEYLPFFGLCLFKQVVFTHFYLWDWNLLEALIVGLTRTRLVRFLSFSAEFQLWFAPALITPPPPGGTFYWLIPRLNIW